MASRSMGHFVFWSSLVWMCSAVAIRSTSVPEWVSMRPNLFDSVKLVKSEDDSDKLYQNVIKQYWNVTSVGTDGEMIDAVEHYFWGLTNGVSMELGALTGKLDTYSQTEIFENFGWKRILIEGNPEFHDKLDLPNAAFVKSAICEKEMDVHYVTQPEFPMTSGIGEFMDSFLVKHFHPELQKASHSRGAFDMTSINWPALTSTNFKVVKCLPLAHILSKLSIHHVNFFILDVEGAEMNVLQSIDFSATIFDVFVIERNHNNWAALEKGSLHPVRAFMADKSYVFMAQKGRNFWYRHESFQPSVRPGFSPNCYRGCVRNYHKGCQPQFCSPQDLAFL